MTPVSVGHNVDQSVSLLDATPLERDDLCSHDIHPKLLTQLPELLVQVGDGDIDVVKAGHLTGKGQQELGPGDHGAPEPPGITPQRRSETLEMSTCELCCLEDLSS